MLNADVRKGRGKLHADKSGQGGGVGKQIFFADVLYGRPLVMMMTIKPSLVSQHSRYDNQYY